MRGHLSEAHAVQQPLCRCDGRRPDSELDERVAAQCGGRREPGHVRARHLLFEDQQRPARVDGHPLRIGLPEYVVEDLERQRAGVAGVQHAGREAGKREAALAGKAAVMPAPLQDVHDQVRSVGQLDEQQLLGRDLRDGAQIGPAREDVKTVQAHPERWMIRLLDNPPRMVVFIDVPAPRESLVGHADSMLSCSDGQEMELLGGKRVIVDRIARDIRADQDRSGAQPLHELELGLGATKVVLQLLDCDGLEVTKRLIEIDAEPEIGRPCTDLLGRELRADQVRLEDLHAIEAGTTRGGELVFQRAAQTHRGDPVAHA